MTSGGNARPPLLCRLLVRMASWIVPARARAAWRSKWDASLWNWWILYERGELTGQDRAELLRHSWGSFQDALWLRISPEQLRHALRSPAFLLGSEAALFLAIAVVSGGFAGTRALFQPVPIADPDALVSIRYTGTITQPYGVPPRLVPLWRDRSRLLAGVAGYVRRPYSTHARVSPDFFSLLGTPAVLGRTFRPGDGGVAVLSNSVWRTVYGADPEVIGKPITVEGREYNVIGVLPAGFWAVSRTVQVWTPLDLEPAPPADVPFLIGAVGRLRPGADPQKVRVELLELARAAGRYLPRAPEVTPYRAIPERTVFLYAAVAVFALIIGFVLPALGRLISFGHGWRYSTLLAVKTLFAAAIPLLAWIETGAALRSVIPEGPPRELLTGVALTLVFIFTAALTMWWSFADQRRRCPVCLYRLAMPVTMGSWASVFDPVTTEMLCDSGHGTLCLPETDAGLDRWMGMDGTWAELFNRKP